MSGVTTPCLITPTCTNAQGYGHLRFEGRAVRAHRLAYVLANGLSLSDIEGLEIRHTCDNPACINPDHLVPGSHADNMQDMMQRGRGRQPKGSGNGRAKLDESRVREIRAAVARGEAHASVAARVGVNPSQVTRIANRKIWSHVE